MESVPDIDDDFLEFLRLLTDHKVRYVVIGGYAALHVVPALQDGDSELALNKALFFVAIGLANGAAPTVASHCSRRTRQYASYCNCLAALNYSGSHGRRAQPQRNAGEGTASRRYAAVRR